MRAEFHWMCIQYLLLQMVVQKVKSNIIISCDIDTQLDLYCTL